VVPEDKRPWSVAWPEYAPPMLVAPVVLAHAGEGGWADAPDVAAVRARLQREGVELGPDGYPRHPQGRQGLAGRGLLGAGGPNPAADPIGTRVTGEGELQVVGIVRKDNGRVALPGGMRDLGEDGRTAAERELREETGLELSLAEGRIVYDGLVVGEWRSTDNAWITTTAVHRHLAPGEGDALVPHGSDDAREARWMTLTRESVAGMNANHGEMLKRALRALRDDGLPLPKRALEQLATTGGG